MLKELLYIGAGGFIGSVLRYLVSVAMNPATGGFPWGTFTVNIVGCLAIGFLGGFIYRHPSLSTPWGLFLTVGLCGGFTTFSTFSKEALSMLQCGNLTGLAGYLLGSIVLGITAVWAGAVLAK